MAIDAFGLRRWAYLGARYCPRWWLRLSPGPIGLLCGRLATLQRRRVQAVLHWTLGSDERTNEVFRNYGHCLAESLALQRTGPPSVEVKGLQRLLDVSAAGQGAILLTAHTGAWEVAAAALAARHGIPLGLVVKAEDDPRASELHQRLRADRGVDTLQAESATGRALQVLAALGRGQWVAMQVDRPAASARSLSVPLFGRNFALPLGPFQLARSLGVPLLPVFNARKGFLKYEVEIFPAHTLPKTATPEQMLQAAGYVAGCLQQFVSRHPTQWFHFCEPPSQ